MKIGNMEPVRESFIQRNTHKCSGYK